MTKQQFGAIGLAVMGKNLAMNIESRGYTVSVFNRSKEKTLEMVAETKGRNITGTYSIEEFIQSLEKPRKIMLMVKAGGPTDATIEQLIPHLEKGDILIDGGNAYFVDTQARNKRLSELGIHFIGTGVSGGEEGALKGPSIMPGVKKKPMNWSHRFLKTFQLKSKGTRVRLILVLMVLGIMSKWCTTALNTAICS